MTRRSARPGARAGRDGAAASPRPWRVIVRGGGEMASGAAHRLFRVGCQVIILEQEHPTAVRRAVVFSEAVYEGQVTVEGVPGRLCADAAGADTMAREGTAIPVLIDPEAESLGALPPDAVVDARLLKREAPSSSEAATGSGPRGDDAPDDRPPWLQVGLGPGFLAPLNCDLCVETQRGHTLGRVIAEGSAAPYTGVPYAVDGHTHDRVIRASRDGVLRVRVALGALVNRGEIVGEVNGAPLAAGVGGLVRGLLRDGTKVRARQKLGDIDPRGARVDHRLISDKARAIAGGVMEAVLGRLQGRIP